MKNCAVKGLTKRGLMVVEKARQSKMDEHKSREWNYLNYITEYGKKIVQVS